MFFICSSSLFASSTYTFPYMAHNKQIINKENFNYAVQKVKVDASHANQRRSHVQWSGMDDNHISKIHCYLYASNCLVHTHTHPFISPLSGTTQVSRYQKGKTNLAYTQARASEWQSHQLGHMQVCNCLLHVMKMSDSEVRCRSQWPRG